MKALIAILSTLLLLVALQANAEEQNVSPGINDHYLSDPDYDVWVGMFESPGREVYDKRKEVIKVLDLQPGMDIADIGAGTGLYTRAFSQEVGPEGTVYAVDIAPNFIDGIMRQAEASGIKNVVGIVNSAKDAGLDPASVDMAFVCDTYHHFEYPRTMLQSMHKSIRPGGDLVIIDFRKKPGFSSRWVMSHTRANKETVIQEIEAQGFKLLEDRDFLTTNFYLRFKRIP